MSHRVPRLTGPALAVLLLTACTSGDAQEVPRPSADPCLVDSSVEQLPEECVEQGPDDGGTAPPSASAAIDPVTIPPAENELARAANDTDPTLTKADFEVTVPAGGRLKSTVACHGAGDTVLTTVPRSGAMQEFRCEYGAEPVELTVAAATPLAQAQTYEVTFTAGTPSRWAVVLSYEMGPPDAEPLPG